MPLNPTQSRMMKHTHTAPESDTVFVLPVLLQLIRALRYILQTRSWWRLVCGHLHLVTSSPFTFVCSSSGPYSTQTIGIVCTAMQPRYAFGASAGGAVALQLAMRFPLQAGHTCAVQHALIAPHSQADLESWLSATGSPLAGAQASELNQVSLLAGRGEHAHGLQAG